MRARYRLPTIRQRIQLLRVATLLLVAGLSALQPVAADEDEASAAAAPALPVAIRSVLNRRNLPESSLSLYVANVDSGDLVLALNPDQGRNPASVMKLVTTLVALDTLGPTYRWRTEFWPQGTLVDGELDGDLLVKGYGDPFLVTERVWVMLRSLRRAGLQRINGDLLLDDSYFDIGEYDPSAFDGQPLRSYNVEPNALMMNFKAVSYFFVPDANGQDVRIELDPALQNLDVVNQLRQRDGSCRGYQRGVAINGNVTQDRMTFSGRFPNGCTTWSMTRSALRHNAYTYGLFRLVWEDVGGELQGAWRSTRFEPGVGEKPLYTFDSWPLADVIARVNKYSNNVMARHLLLTVGAETLGIPGTVEKGQRATVNWLAERGIDAEGFEIPNGAGLARNARISARQLGSMLEYAYKQPYMPEYLSSMSVTGLDGTTTRRYSERDAIAGRAHMKTGRLDHVSAVAGYVHARSGARYAVVVLQNHPDIHRGYGEEVQAAVLRWVFDH